MSADAGPVPTSLRPAAPLTGSPITAQRIETAAALAACAFTTIVGLQALPLFIEQMSIFSPSVALLLLVVHYGLVALAILASIVRVAARPVFIANAVAFLCTTAAWPIIAMEPMPSGQPPWLYLFATMMSGLLAVAFPRRVWLAVLYTTVTAVAYFSIRISPTGGGLDVGAAALEAVYHLLLGGTIIAVLHTLRSAARRVDVAQAEALGEYGSAVRESAREHERAEVDALVHDSVLTTLLTAASAATQRQADLASAMSLTAMRRLALAQSGGADADDLLPLEKVAARLRREVGGLDPRIEVRAKGVVQVTVPTAVADAVVLAATQAVVNSLQHAGDGATRRVEVKGKGSGGFEVLVADDGRGFGQEAYTTGRLGLRGSIIERMRVIGGEARVDSAPGKGVRISLRWPRASTEVEQQADDTAEVAVP